MATEPNNQQRRDQNGEHVRPLSDMSNREIFDAIRNSIGGSYAHRIPSSTQADIRDSMDQIMRFPDLRNEFYAALVNRICGMYINEMGWDNYLSEFKRASQNYGDVWEEVAIDLVKAQAYDENSEYLAQDIYGTYKTNVKSVFHHVNRDDYYAITIREKSLKRAFLADDGLSKFVAQLMDRPRTSDNFDEFLAMTHLFTEYARSGGYYRVHTPDMAKTDPTSDDAKQMLRVMQNWVLTLPLEPSAEFNPMGMTAVVKPEDLIFFVTPEVHSALNVMGYATLFDGDKADTNRRMIDIRSKNFNIPGVQAILTTRQFFFVYDTIYETANSTVHPISLGTNMFLRHQESISVSPFAPALLFWTGPGTQERIVLPDGAETQKPEFQIRLSGYGEPAEQPKDVTRGDMVQVVAHLVWKGDPTFKPKEAVSYKLTTPPTSDFTHITNHGVLVVGLDEKLDTLKVQAKAVYVNPNIPEVDNTASVELEVPVVGNGSLGFNANFLVSLTVSPKSVAEADVPDNGQTIKFICMANMANGRDIDVTSMVKWEVSDENAGTIALNGVYTVKDKTVQNAVVASVFGINSNQAIIKDPNANGGNQQQ